MRTEGEIDPRSRMVHAVARVENPYERGADPDRPPLAAGLWVEAEIAGIKLKDVMVLPRAALRGEDQMLVLDDDDRLHFRTVDVLRRTRDRVILRGGLEAGERVCLTPLAVVAEGMQVRVEDS